MSEFQSQRITSKRRWSAALLLTLGVVVSLVCAWPASAAIELLYFNIATSRSAVLLEWSTAKEYNLLGFQVMCKQAGESDASYHPIGTRSATGSSTSGANYEFLVTSGLTEGVPYCFRLREITSNGEPGEIFDRCGFGLSMTPTATLLPEFVAATSTAAAATSAAVAAAAALSQTVIITDANGITSTVDPLLLLTATPTIDPNILLLTPSPPPQPGSPLQPPATATLDPVMLAATATANAIAAATAQQAQFDAAATAAVANATAQQAQFDAAATAAASATAAFTASATALASTPTVTASATITSSLTPTVAVNTAGIVDPNAPAPVVAGPETPVPPVVANAPAPVDVSAAAVPQDANLAAASLPPAVDNTSYVVVTAVPTQAPLSLAPTLTPLPTGIPTQEALLSNVFAATTQNMMILLLLIVFSGATGIGVLGLLSGVLYVRMREGRRRRYD